MGHIKTDRFDSWTFGIGISLAIGLFVFWGISWLIDLRHDVDNLEKIEIYCQDGVTVGIDPGCRVDTNG